jgi:hypothetical protein
MVGLDTGGLYWGGGVIFGFILSNVSYILAESYNSRQYTVYTRFQKVLTLAILFVIDVIGFIA